MMHAVFLGFRSCFFLPNPLFACGWFLNINGSTIDLDTQVGNKSDLFLLSPHPPTTLQPCLQTNPQICHPPWWAWPLSFSSWAIISSSSICLLLVSPVPCLQIPLLCYQDNFSKVKKNSHPRSALNPWGDFHFLRIRFTTFAKPQSKMLKQGLQRQTGWGQIPVVPITNWVTQVVPQFLYLQNGIMTVSTS